MRDDLRDLRTDQPLVISAALIMAGSRNKEVEIRREAWTEMRSLPFLSPSSEHILHPWCQDFELHHFLLVNSWCSCRIPEALATFLFFWHRFFESMTRSPDEFWCSQSCWSGRRINLPATAYTHGYATIREPAPRNAPYAG